ncbi:hypothetical protein JCM14076_21040 [Methylosoma difficile]
MVSNTQGQASEIANLEIALWATEKYIDSKRYEKGSLPNKAAGEPQICQSSGGFYNQLSPGQLSSSDINVDLPNGSSVEITKTACLNGNGNQLNETDCSWLVNDCNKPTTATNPCDVEIYTIAITMKNSTNNERSVVSRYAVNCKDQ